MLRRTSDTKRTVPQQRLNGWKEIAAHFDVSVRTVQRWERAENLPVRRHRHTQLSSVYADPADLDRWWESRPAAIPLFKPRRSKAKAGVARPTIAVLPFTNLDRDEETEIFSDGLTEDMIAVLGQVSQLRVVARSSAIYFKGKARDVREIGQRLGVEYVLEGSVRRAGKRLRITAQLVSVADGCHLWAQRFDREIDDPFELQDELAQAIATRLRVRLLGKATARRRIDDIETYNTFLRGRFFWNQRTPKGLERAVGHLKKAIGRNSHFALAHAGLADCYVFLSVYAGRSPRKMLSKARAAVSRALEIDPMLSEAHTTLGLVRVVSFDLQGAERAFTQALDFRPRDHRAQHWRAMVLACMGHTAEAIAGIEEALELDPLGVTVNQDAGRILFFAHRFEEAIRRLRHTLEIAPNLYWARVYLTLAYVCSEKYEEALKAAAVEPALRAFVRARMGDAAEAERLLQKEGQPGSSFVWTAILHLALGRYEHAIRCFKRAARRLEVAFLELYLGVQLLFPRLGSDPEFVAFLAGRTPEGSP